VGGGPRRGKGGSRGGEKKGGKRRKGGGGGEVEKKRGKRGERREEVGRRGEKGENKQKNFSFLFLFPPFSMPRCTGARSRRWGEESPKSGEHTDGDGSFYLAYASRTLRRAARIADA